VSALDQPESKPPLVRRTCLCLLGALVLLAIGTYFAQGPIRAWQLKQGVASLQGLAAPGTASASDPPGAHRHTFSKGEWVVGVSQDSHTIIGGGVLVVRDSRGATRAFVGHVCGAGAFERTCRVLEMLAQGEAAPDLDALYRHLEEEFEEREVSPQGTD